jgi:two-component system CheB/CheR fusion protein
MQLTSDLDNLLASVQFPIVMVDGPLTVRRATPAARDAFNILPTDNRIDGVVLTLVDIDGKK